MSKIRKRKWTTNEAMAWICAVNCGKEKHGLKYLSACDFLGISPDWASNLR